MRTSVIAAAAVLGALNSAAAQSSRFDGYWMIALSCPATPDGQALGYGYQFPATVKDGVLHGERGVKDKPGWLSLDGSIGPDGRADLIAEGRTNLPAYALYNAPTGRPFKHAVRATFEPTHGTGEWTTIRTCTFTFDRRCNSLVECAR